MGNPRAFDHRPCPGGGAFEPEVSSLSNTRVLVEEFSLKVKTLLSGANGLERQFSHWRKTNQQHYFARFYNICCSHKKKVSILRGEAILTQEGRNLLKLRIDQCITMIIFVKKHNLFKQYMSSGELFVEFFFLTFLKCSIVCFENFKKGKSPCWLKRYDGPILPHLCLQRH